MQNRNQNQPGKDSRNNHIYNRNLLDFTEHQWAKNIYTFHPIETDKNHKHKLKTKKSQKQISENEIFVCVLIFIILGIHVGGNAFIQYRTKQKIIDISTPQISIQYNHK